MNKTISIAGVLTDLIQLGRDELKGMNLDLLLSFRFYEMKFNNHELCVVESIDVVRSYTPGQYKRMTILIERIVKMPVAFYLLGVPFYIRSRLIEQGVYFIVSDRYVFLPGLLINERIKKKLSKGQGLSSVAQYILLYYLLHKEIDKFTMQEIQSYIPYNYLAVSRAINDLEEKQLFHIRKEWKTKLVSSPVSRKELWEKALPYLSSPVKKTVYTNSIWNGPFYKGGMSALSHYSFLNPDDQQTLVIWDKNFELDVHPYLEWEAFESKYKIEIWKYSPQMRIEQEEYVDKLSLYLSMQDDNDPRVEKELETIINEIWQ